MNLFVGFFICALVIPSLPRNLQYSSSIFKTTFSVLFSRKKVPKKSRTGIVWGRLQNFTYETRTLRRLADQTTGFCGNFDAALSELFASVCKYRMHVVLSIEPHMSSLD